MKISKVTMRFQMDTNENVRLVAKETTLQILQEPFNVTAKDFLIINFEMLGSVSLTAFSYGTCKCAVLLTSDEYPLF